MKARQLVDGSLVEEGLGHQVLDPRLRTFYIRRLTEAGGIDVGNLYCGDESPFNFNVRTRVLKKSIEQLVERLNELNLEEGDAPQVRYCLQQVPPPS